MSLIWIVNILSVFFLCVFFAGIVIPQILLIAFRRRLFDEPDERKIHQCVVPRLGGMAFKPVVFFSFVLLLAVNVSTGHDELLKEIGAEALPLAYAFCAIIMLYLVGIADDLIGVRYRAKFFIQIVCGIMLVAGGVELSDLHGMLFIHSMPSWISIPLTVFVTVFIINAINLIDGIDGLASGLCSIAFLFYGMTFIWFHQYLYAMLAFATLGVLIPFYYYKEIYIETERIIIRNFKQKDAEGLLEYLSNPRVNCFAGDRLCSEEAAWAYMQYSPKDMLRYAVSLKKMTLLSVTCSLCVRMKTLIMWGGISTNVLKAKDSLVKRQPDCWIIFSGRRAHGVSMDLWKMTISAPNAYANVLVCAAKDVSKSL